MPPSNEWYINVLNQMIKHYMPQDTTNFKEMNFIMQNRITNFNQYIDKKYKPHLGLGDLFQLTVLCSYEKWIQNILEFMKHSSLTKEDENLMALNLLLTFCSVFKYQHDLFDVDDKVCYDLLKINQLSITFEDFKKWIMTYLIILDYALVFNPESAIKMLSNYASIEDLLKFQEK